MSSGTSSGAELQARPFRTLVLGGGVAGLGLAQGLAVRGLPVHVVEKSAEAPDDGFGFLLMPNGLAALRQLGSDIDPRRAGMELRRALITTTDGTVLVDEGLQGVVGTTRRALMESLRSSVRRTAGDVVQHGSSVAHLDWKDGRARRVVLDNGAELEADLFCGADGVRSPCRAAAMGPSRPRPGRVKEIVARADDAALAAALGDTFRKFVHPDGGLAVGLVPAGAGQVIWFVQFDSARFDAPEPGAERAFVARHLYDFPDLVHDAWNAAQSGAPHTWHTVDMDPVDVMAAGNVALLGDAAHPLLPFTSQGANSALRDAAALARAVDQVVHQGRDLSTALAEYHAARHPEAVRFVAAGRRLASEFVLPPVATPTVPLAV